MAEEQTTPPPAENSDGVDALATPEAGSASGAPSEQVTDATDKDDKGGDKSQAPKKPSIFKRFNIYFLVFIFILMMAGIILIMAYTTSKKQTSTNKVKTQDLTAATLQQLATSDASVGSAQQVLNIQSSAVFAGKVLIRDGLEVASSLRVGGSSSLSNLAVAGTLAVSGTTQLQQAQITKNLSVAGDTSVQGAATIAKSLQVNGPGTFGGPLSAPQITTSNFQLNSDLTLTHHIIAGGPTPGLSRGSALGNGGTTSISGSDTSGSVSINVGSSAGAGCFVSINFAAKFNSTPHVLITPVGSETGKLDFYVNRSSSSFSICDSTPPPAGSYGFDYFVVN